MSRPTTIRSALIGNKLGTVVTILNPFSVWFQLYDIGFNGNKDGPYAMIREDEFDCELDAVALFGAWKKEAELLHAVGDI